MIDWEPETERRRRLEAKASAAAAGRLSKLADDQSAADDLAWASADAAWINREYEPMPLLAEYVRLDRSGQRIPLPLQHWIADAFESAVAAKPGADNFNMTLQDAQGKALLQGLGVRQPTQGNTRRKLPHGTLLRIEKHTRKMTERQLAKKYGVGKSAMHTRLQEGELMNRDWPSFERGALLGLRMIRKLRSRR